MERSYALLEIRSTDDELREFEGIANTNALDAHGTIVEPGGARFSLPIPLLWFHDQQTPVGEVTHAELRGGKWWVRGVIRKVEEPGKVKDAVDQAWHSLKYKLVKGLSIGFTPLKEKGQRFIEWFWKELSLVTIPSNQEASIVSVRSAYLAASGDSQIKSPGVSGLTPTPRHGKMTFQEQITSHTNTRGVKVSQRDALLEKAGNEGRTLDESEKETFDTLETEIRSIDDTIVRLESAQKDIEKRAVAVNGSSITNGSNSRGVPTDIQNRKGVPIVRVQSAEPKGLGYARYVMSIAASNGNKIVAEEYAKRTFGPDKGEETALMLRSAVEPGTTTDADWAAPLVKTTYLEEFLELLRPATIIGRVPGLRRVPFNISMPKQTQGGTYSWVGEAAAKPVGDMKFETVTLGQAVAAGIIVITKQLARSSAPSAQVAVRDELIAGMARYLDLQFVDPSVGEVSNVSPASITNSVTGAPATGTDLDSVRADFATLLAPFVTSGLGLGGVVFLMNEGEAFALSMLFNEFGARAFPELNPTGGSIFGVPVVTSNTIVDQIIAAHTPSILFADDGQTEIDISEQASIEMDTTPTDPAANTIKYVSLWQRNLIALRAERWINWKVARDNAVNVITGVGGTGS